MSAGTGDSAVRVDGRNARRGRNSEAVLDAAHALFAEGNLMPSAEDVAARSGVSLRSVYRYFEDADALMRAAIARRVALVGHLFDLPDLGEGTQADRVQRYVDHRLALYAALAPSIRAALLRAPSAEPIAERLDSARRQLFKQTEEHFAVEAAEIGDLRGPTVIACVDTLCQFESVENLRLRRRMSKARTRAALVAGVTALLAPLP